MFHGRSPQIFSKNRRKIKSQASNGVPSMIPKRLRVHGDTFTTVKHPTSKGFRPNRQVFPKIGVVFPPKSSILRGFSIIKPSIVGVSLFLETPNNLLRKFILNLLVE